MSRFRAALPLVAPLVVLFFAGTALSVFAQTQPAQRTPDSITVTGNATVTLPPDQAQVKATVQTQTDTAAEAADQNSRTMQAVIDAIRELGVPADKIVTSGFSVSPQYSYTQPQPGEPSQPPTIAGYKASNSVTVTTTQLDQASSILQAMAGAGATDISGPSYQLQHPEQLQIQAEQAASANALQRAQAIAGGLGVRLGEVLSANEGSNVLVTPRLAATAAPPPPPPLPGNGGAGGAGGAGTLASPPVLPPSSLSASATVTVVFAVVNQPAAGGTGP